MMLVIVSGLWVIAATVVALLPMRQQYIPGVALLLAAPVLIFLLARSFGVWVAIVAIFAFVSMFRNPLRYFAKRALGQKSEIPK